MVVGLGSGAGQIGADGRADADRVAGGDGEHGSAGTGESDGGWDHAGGADGHELLSTRAGIRQVVVLPVARLARLHGVMGTTVVVMMVGTVGLPGRRIAR